MASREEFFAEEVKEKDWLLKLAPTLQYRQNEVGKLERLKAAYERKDDKMLIDNI